MSSFIVPKPLRANNTCNYHLRHIHAKEFSTVTYLDVNSNQYETYKDEL